MTRSSVHGPKRRNMKKSIKNQHPKKYSQKDILKMCKNCKYKYNFQDNAWGNLISILQKFGKKTLKEIQKQELNQ